MENPSHDTKMIVESQAFVALNVLIQRKVVHLKWLHEVIENMMQQLLKQDSKYPPSVNTLTSYENKNFGEILLKFFDKDMERLRDMIDEAVQEEKSISELVRYKLRLLNDYDFTHGENEEQLKVFGPVPT
jgi:hypothetical protein